MSHHHAGSHVNHRPTKEVFYDVMSATAFTQAINGHYGAQVNDDQDLATIQAFIPHDFAELEELALVVIPNLAAVAMTFMVMCSYGRKDELATMGGTLLQHSFGPTQAAGANNATIREINIGMSVVPFGGRSLRARDQFGLVIQRVAGQNTDFWVLGVRIKYKYK